MNKKCYVECGSVHGHVSYTPYTGRFLDYILLCGRDRLAISEIQIDDAIDVLIELREKKIVEFGRTQR